MKFTDIQSFQTYYEKQKKLLDQKFLGKGKKKAVLLCSGTGCLASESLKIHDRFEELIKEKGLEKAVSLNIVGCFGLCSQGPFVKIYPNDTLYKKVTVKDVEEIVTKDLMEDQVVERLLFTDSVTNEKYLNEKTIPFYRKQTKIALYGCSIINPESIDEAIGYGSFQGIIKALDKSPKEVIDIVSESGLRGRGGGGFPTGRKWSFAFNQKDTTRYCICNADEGDPGAFMDESILEGNPFSLIEGMMIAGFAIKAQLGIIYIRAEYPTAVNRLQKAIKQCQECGILGEHIFGTDFSFDLKIRLGAGAFVCGEETALINSIEGKRGMPRPRPPFPAVKGLWGHPSIVNNVETYACVPYILRNGAGSFNMYGTDKSKGTKVFALGGKVNNVGLVEVPMGTTLRELIFEIGGGIPNGKKFKAIQTGGPSGGCLTEEFLDEAIDFDNLVAKGSMMGSGGAIVMDEDNCMVDVAKFYMEFICDESCGKCSPCRIGTKRILEILNRITEGKGTLEDLDKLKELARATKNGSLCALGQTAANPILSTMEHFYDEYVAHVVDKKCPAHVCKDLIEYHIDSEQCKKCGLCSRKCPMNCISGIVGKNAFVIDNEHCIKCGTCIAACPFGAISKE